MANATVVGKIGGEIRKGDAGGTPVLNFSVGERKYVGAGKGYNGSAYDTQWWRVAIFGKRAESLSGLLDKGKWVAVVGDAGLKKYTHQGQDRYDLEIRANDVHLVGDKNDSSAAAPSASSESHAYAADDPGIPF